MQTIEVIDSHTGGEPTRLILSGGPDLGSGPLQERVARFRENFDHYRAAIVNEPRGSDIVVGALLCTPHRPDCQLGVIYFNNVGYIGMCGHGTIGLIASLAHLRRLTPGAIRIDTPVGAVEARLRADGQVEVDNVASFRRDSRVSVIVPGVGKVTGDVAWGGNWFFLVTSIDAQHRPEWTIAPQNIGALTELTWRIRQAINTQGFAEVDHVELFATTNGGKARSRNFVLCPGKAYDRSPCGTGTSAKLACLAADGALAPGEEWLQESIIGSTFGAHYRWLDQARGHIKPTIIGAAYITAEALLRLNPDDPLRWGIPTATASMPGRDSAAVAG
jgi:4-hydroxyproline epimerase